LQGVDLLEHSRLRDDVEAGRGLVQDDDGWLAREAHRDHHALLLPARELMRIAAGERVGRGEVEVLESAFDADVFRATRDMLVEHVLDRRTHPQRRVEGVSGILRDVRDEASAKWANGSFVARADRAARDLDAPRDDPNARSRVTEERERGRRLAAAGLPSPRISPGATESELLDHAVADSSSTRRSLTTSACSLIGRPPPTSV
jgi:hypothetical protein